MNKRLAKLQEEHAALLAQMRDSLDLMDTESREPTEDEQATYNECEVKANALATKIEQEEKLQEKEKKAKVIQVGLDTTGDLGGHIESQTEGFENDPKCGFKDFGAFALAVQRAMTPGMEQVAADMPRLNYLSQATGMNAAIGSQGGFLLPQTFNLTIWDNLRQDEENLMNRCDRYTVEGESLTFNANAETSKVAGSRYGGIQGYWLHEAEQKDHSKPTFRQIKIEPKELAILVYVTDKLLRGAGIALSQYLTKAASDEIAFMVNDAIINGTGAGQPLGIIASTAEVSVAKQDTQAVGSTTIVTENIVKMWARCLSRARRRSVWLINQSCEPQLMTMTLNVGTGGAPTYLPVGGLSTSPYATLLGRPVVPCEWCAAVGTVGDIILADLGYYCLGTKGGIMSDMSIHLRFDYNETVFRFVYEVDGQPWTASPLTPYKGATHTVAPFVTLATR